MKAILYNRILLVLGFLGVFVAGILSLAHLNHVVPMCGTSGGCEKVTTDASSVWFGFLPVAYLGFAAYLALTALAVMRSLSTMHYRKLVILGYGISGGGTLISFGLQFYSYFVIKEMCKWCLASAAIMTITLLFYTVLFQFVAEESDEELAVPKRSTLDSLLPAGMAALAILALGVGGKMLTTADEVKGVHVENLPKDYPLIPKDPNIFGDAKAPVTIVEFADLDCPSCQANSPKLKEVVRENEGKIRLIYRHFPLTQRHPTAMIAAVIAEYAAEKGKFWEFAMAVMALKSEDTPPDELFKIASNLNLDPDDIKKRLSDDNDPIYRRVTIDRNAANAMGITSTPTFIVTAPGVETQAYGPGKIFDALNGPDYQKIIRAKA